MIIVLGAGESGVGAAILAASKGLDVFVSDNGPISQHYKQELEKWEIGYEENGHNSKRILKADLIIKSPGIPRNVPLIKEIEKRDVKIISEIEWGFQYCDATLIAITGSNGKTTVTNLISHLMKTAGLSVVKCGNVGDSFAKAVALEKADYYVIEISSFQLEDIHEFKPDISIITNITPDHLDRYQNDLLKYAKTKLRITENQTKEETLILGNVDIWTKELIAKKNIKAQIVYTDDLKNGDLRIGDNNIQYDNVSLSGNHNLANVACAISTLNLLNMDYKTVEEGLNTFMNDPHRMERVRELEGVTWVNDSKATNVDAVFYALEAQNQPIVWIVGGEDKGNDYTILDELIKDHVKAIICLGVDNTKLLNHFEGMIAHLKDTKNMQDAVLWAQRIAKKGDLVLLSPACASFDLFDNYIQRGEIFKKEVEKLKIS